MDEARLTVNAAPVLVPGAATAAELDALLAHAHLARLRPTADRYPLTEWMLSPLPELCDAHGVALLLDFAPGPIDWAAAVPVARAYPTVPFVILGCDLSVEAAAGPALDATLNLVLQVEEVSQVVLDTYGGHRFVRDGDETTAKLADGTYASTHF